MSEEPIRDKLAREIDVVRWTDLRSHAAANRVFLVARELDLIEVAVAVASDQTATVEAWIASEHLTRPSTDQMRTWEHTEEHELRCVIVAPFVLTQEQQP